MDRLEKPKKFIEELGLSNSDYSDAGMIDHIADLLERYSATQLRSVSVSDIILAWEKFKKDNWWQSESIDVEKVLMKKFQRLYEASYDAYLNILSASTSSACYYDKPEP